MQRIPFAKLTTIFSTSFGVALGLCGVNWLFISIRYPAIQGIFSVTAMGELVVMVVSAIGLIITVILWVIAELFGSGQHSGDDPVRLFDPRRDDHKDE